MSHISGTYAWHGRLMVLAWTILLPAGMFIARYFKVTRSQDWPRELDNKLWWHSHLALQILGVLIMSAAVTVVWSNTASSGFGHSLHATLGWCVVALAWLQIAGGFLRGSKGGPPLADAESGAARAASGDHYDMTSRRVIFEWLHKLGGYLALALSVLVTALGLQLAAAPLWMWLVIAAWWAALLVAAWRLQRAGRCVDTYQAIWGPDPRHPGNSRALIGWGIRRHRQ